MNEFIGVGIYPDAIIEDVTLALPVPNVPVLIMGKPKDERHNFAQVLAAQGCDVTRRHWEEDNDQIDWDLSPEQNSDVWYDRILGGLTPEQFKRIYRRAVGPNEYIGDDKVKFPYACAFEVTLANKLQADGIAYFWGNIAVGNVEPADFATAFAGINAIAAGVCAHVYVAPHRKTLEPPFAQDYARRPFAWFTECKKRGVRFPQFLAGESGTYYPWTQEGMSEDDYFALLKEISAMLGQWKAAGMSVVGHCLFAFGAEGDMGKNWNVSTTLLQTIGTYNRSCVPMTLVQKFPHQFTEWVAAGGIENNFHKHLLGIGALPPTWDDVVFLAKELNADVQQMDKVVTTVTSK